MSRPALVAVIDIGSNSIKSLVAARAPDGQLVAIKQRTLDARISAGIGKEKPALSEEGMTRGLGAIRELIEEVSQRRPAKIQLVATSAVRDASNGADFRERVKKATKHEIRLLSGDEEANLIGRGLLCDPALAELRNFYVFDLGGGSLECLAFKNRKTQKAVSLQLGCVRLTEKFVKDPAAPVSLEVLAEIAAHVTTTLKEAGLNFDLPDSVGIATGGTVTTVRALFGAREQLRAEETSPAVSLDQLKELLPALAALPLDQRKRVPGMPSARADVFPAALATIIAVAELGGFAGFIHSFYNLRWGLAAEMLDQV
ncbi:MAG: exopolyphosphatase / guanosine-5-triphosphate,3-diphosphate pyrophosphatase [Verrucomicrobiota bacterium]|nr:exopolyphosphatase / guanosine-5-triphosphate,3-diphosphate pyrophosphatase [Verrucomicrobiota bacterium]